jgi:uncharacterized OsmC-like protein
MVASDKPFEDGGTDMGMTPGELLLAALGTSAALYATEYLRARGVSEAGIELVLNAERRSQPSRYGLFLIVILLPETAMCYSEGLLRAVKACIVSHTLQNQPQMLFELRVRAESDGV